jgi:hypothetical protein
MQRCCFIRDITGITYFIEYNTRDTVLDIKRRLAVQGAGDVIYQNIVIAGRSTPNTELFESYNPQTIGKIHLVIR